MSSFEDNFWEMIEAKHLSLVPAAKHEQIRAQYEQARTRESELVATGDRDFWIESAREKALTSVDRLERRNNVLEYLEQTPEHEGMFIPSRSDADFHPTTYEGNYIISKGSAYAVRMHHAHKDVAGQAFQQSSSWMNDAADEPLLFDTQEEAVAAVHRHKLLTDNAAGGIYLHTRVQGEDGWLVVHERHWELTADRLPWSDAEQSLYRDGKDSPSQGL